MTTFFLSKSFKIITTVLLIMAGLAVLGYLQNKQTHKPYVVNQAEVTDWPKYQNTRFGFEFQHPSDRPPVVDYNPDTKSMNLAEPWTADLSISDHEGRVSPGFSIKVYDKATDSLGNQPPYDWAKQYVLPEFFSRASKITFAGKPAYELKGITLQDSKTGQDYIDYDHYGILVERDNYAIIIGKYKSSILADTVVETFTFID